MTILNYAKNLGYTDKEIKRILFARNILPSTFANEMLKNLFDTSYRIEKKHTFVIIASKINL